VEVELAAERDLDRREGYLDQERYATAHLAIGYATFAAVGVAVGALVF
jgi:hypothetical protein